MTGQGDPPASRTGVMAISASLLIFSAAAALAAPSAADRPTPSGLPVPRYVTLKFDDVNARAGPGDDHRLLWVYHARGLPVQVVAENLEWRRICDPEGGLAWVHKRTTDGRRAVIRLKPGAVTLYSHPKTDARVAAYLNSRALAGLVKCNDKGWCKVQAEGVGGWVAPGQVWGTDERPQCG
jgi:SH3-like domain-containing protein